MLRAGSLRLRPSGTSMDTALCGCPPNVPVSCWRGVAGDEGACNPVPISCTGVFGCTGKSLLAAVHARGPIAAGCRGGGATPTALRTTMPRRAAPMPHCRALGRLNARLPSTRPGSSVLISARPHRLPPGHVDAPRAATERPAQRSLSSPRHTSPVMLRNATVPHRAAPRSAAARPTRLPFDARPRARAAHRAPTRGLDAPSPGFSHCGTGLPAFDRAIHLNVAISCWRGLARRGTSPASP